MASWRENVEMYLYLPRQHKLRVLRLTERMIGRALQHTDDDLTLLIDNARLYRGMNHIPLSNPPSPVHNNTPICSPAK